MQTKLFKKILFFSSALVFLLAFTAVKATTTVQPTRINIGGASCTGGSGGQCSGYISNNTSVMTSGGGAMQTGSMYQPINPSTWTPSGNFALGGAQPYGAVSGSVPVAGTLKNPPAAGTNTVAEYLCSINGTLQNAIDVPIATNGTWSSAVPDGAVCTLEITDGGGANNVSAPGVTPCDGSPANPCSAGVCSFGSCQLITTDSNGDPIQPGTPSSCTLNDNSTCGTNLGISITPGTNTMYQGDAYKVYNITINKSGPPENFEFSVQCPFNTECQLWQGGGQITALQGCGWQSNGSGGYVFNCSTTYLGAGAWHSGWLQTVNSGASSTVLYQLYMRSSVFGSYPFTVNTQVLQHPQRGCVGTCSSSAPATFLYQPIPCNSQVTINSGSAFCDSQTASGYVAHFPDWAANGANVTSQFFRADASQAVVDNTGSSCSNPANCTNVAQHSTTFTTTGLSPSTTYWNRAAVVCQNTDNSILTKNIAEWQCSTNASTCNADSFVGGAVSAGHISNPSGSSATVAPGGDVTVACDFGVTTAAPSISYPTGVVSCSWPGIKNGTQYVYYCQAPSTTGSVSVGCNISTVSPDNYCPLSGNAGTLTVNSGTCTANAFIQTINGQPISSNYTLSPSPGNVTFTWNSVPGVSSYHFTMWDATNSSWAVVSDQANVAGTTVTVNNLNPASPFGTRYMVTVYANNPGSLTFCSAGSISPITIKPLSSSCPASPQNLSSAPTTFAPGQTGSVIVPAGFTCSSGYSSNSGLLNVDNSGNLSAAGSFSTNSSASVSVNGGNCTFASAGGPVSCPVGPATVSLAGNVPPPTANYSFNVFPQNITINAVEGQSAAACTGINVQNTTTGGNSGNLIVIRNPYAGSPRSYDTVVSNTGGYNFYETDNSVVSYGQICTDISFLPVGTTTDHLPYAMYTSALGQIVSAGEKTVNITVNISAAPVKNYSFTVSNNLTFTAQQNGPLPSPDKAITVTNNGDQTLTIAISPNLTSGAYTWGSINKNTMTLTPGASDTVTVHITRTDIPAALYNGAVTFTETNAGTKSVGVAYTVSLVCPASSNQVTLGSSNISAGASTTASAPAGFSGGSFSSSNTSVATISGSNVSGVATGSSNISGSNWTYTSGTQSVAGCSLAPTAVTVSALPPPTGDIKCTPPSGSAADACSVTVGQAVNLTWTSTNATSCTVTPGNYIATSNLSGQTTGALSSSQTYTLNCSGPGAPGGVNVDNVPVTVTAAPDFSISSSPPSQTISQGASTSFTITLTSVNNFSGLVNFASVVNCPNNATCTFSPSAPNIPAGGSVPATLIITSQSSAAVGNFTLGVTATDQASGSLSHTTNPLLTINAAGSAPNLTLSASPNPVDYNTPTTLTWSTTGTQPITCNSTAGPWSVVGGGSGNSATFVTTDTTTSGNWQGVYGSQGYNVIGGTQNYPAYVTVTPNSNSFYSWADPTSDTRAPNRNSTGGSTRVADTWYSGSPWTLDFNFSDSSTHKVAIYALDFDSTTRQMTIDILDGVTNAVISGASQNVSNYNGGKYYVWNLTGHVKMRFTNTAGWNAVISGIFFDAASGGSNNGSGTVASSNITSDSTFSMTCTNAFGSSPKSVTVTVKPQTPSGGGGSAGPTCGKITINWTALGNSVDGYRVYRNNSNSFATSTNISGNLTNGTTATQYIDTTPASSNNYYWITSYKGLLESAAGNVSGVPLGATSCDANIVPNKDIIKVNGTAPGTYTPDAYNTNDTPSNVSYSKFDKVSFSLNFPNKAPAGGNTATNLLVTDRLINLRKPTSGWNMKIGATTLTEETAGGSYCTGTNYTTLAINHFVACGTAPNQTIYMKLNNVAQGGIISVTYDAEIYVVTNQTSSRFQNSAQADYSTNGTGGTAQAFTSTPLIVFSVSNVPNKFETAP